MFGNLSRITAMERHHMNGVLIVAVDKRELEEFLGIGIANDPGEDTIFIFPILSRHGVDVSVVNDRTRLIQTNLIKVPYEPSLRDWKIGRIKIVSLMGIISICKGRSFLAIYTIAPALCNYLDMKLSSSVER